MEKLLIGLIVLNLLLTAIILFVVTPNLCDFVKSTKQKYLSVKYIAYLWMIRDKRLNQKFYDLINWKVLEKYSTAHNHFGDRP